MTMIQLCRLLKTDMLQLPSNYRRDSGVTGDLAKVVRDLQEIAVRIMLPLFSQNINVDSV